MGCWSSHHPHGTHHRTTVARKTIGYHARRLRAASLLSAGLLLGACQSPLLPSEPTIQPTLTPTAAALIEPASSVATVTPEPNWKDSVVRIVAAGTFNDPQIGDQIQVGGGTGVIIDPRGLVLTNNHVVGGSPLVEVYVPGEDDPRTGRVLGVSECSDLALIQLDDKGPFTAIEWYDGSIESELPVRKGGHADSAEELNVQEGIISQVQVALHTVWVSLDEGIGHSAKVRPGDSGGALVALEDGRWKLVGINFASINADDQNFAIGRDDAQAFVEAVLEADDDRTVVLDRAIGINGVAVQGEYKGKPATGIWVRAVIPGSPADSVRLKPGDLISVMQRLPLAQDGTVRLYCELLGSNAAAPLDIQVLRTGTAELLEGQINTEGRELVVVGYFGDEPPQPTATEDPPEPAVATDFTPEQAAQLRAVHDTVTSQLRERVFETFDRGMRTRRAWPEGDETGRLRNNRYEIALDEPRMAIWETWSGQENILGDTYALELMVRFPALNPTVEAGLAIDVQPDQSQRLFYTMTSDGRWRIYQGRNLLAEGATPGNFAINSDTDYALWVTRTPDGLIFFFNSVPVAFLTASPYAGGQVGVVGVSGESAPSLVVVNDLMVRAP
jgi:S1-C subfamily serine protease